MTTEATVTLIHYAPVIRGGDPLYGGGIVDRTELAGGAWAVHVALPARDDEEGDLAFERRYHHEADARAELTRVAPDPRSLSRVDGYEQAE